MSTIHPIIIKARAPFAAALFFLALSLLTGCASQSYSQWPKPEAKFYHASSESDLGNRCAMWLWTPNCIATTIGFTGSMRPWLRGGEWVALEAYRGQELHAGMVVVYDRGDLQPIHMIVEVHGDSLLIEGLANHFSDGWHPKKSVKWILREVMTQ